MTKGAIATDTREIQSILRTCSKNLYSRNPENLDEMVNILHIHHLPRLNPD